MSGHDEPAHHADRLALLRQMLEQHAPALELFARQWCDAPEVVDVVQESMVKLAQQHPLPDEPLAWLYTVVRRRAMTAGRSARRRRRYETSAAQQRKPWFTPVNGQSLDAEAAAAALAALPPEQREVVVAHLWGGLTFEAVGRVAGCSSTTAHRRYTLALQTLRARLNGHVRHDER